MNTKRSWMMAALIFFLVLSAAAVPTGTVYAASFTVNDTRDRVDSNPGNGVCRTSAGTCTLRAAIQEANARSGPDVIHLRAATYMLTRAPLNENNISTGDLDITAPLTIIGSGVGVTIIDGGTPPPGSPLERTALDRLFEIHSTAENVTFERLTIREGWDEKEGGAIYNRSLGTVRLVNISILNSFAGTSGGGIYYDGFEGGSMLLERSTITGNSTNGSGGGIYITNGRLTVIGTEAAKSTISGNSARDGGGLYHTGLSSRVDLSFTNVSGNLALNSGGGIYNGLEGELSLADVSISTNAAVGDGGGLASVSKASLSVTRGTFSANTADSGGGGAFTQTEGPVTIDASTFSGNAAGADGGGGLYVSGKGAVNVTGSVVSGNTAIGEGGGMAVHSDGPVDVSDTTVSGNASQASGGGILASGLVVNLIHLNVTGNTALGDGGGIDNQGSGEFAIVDTSIFSNTAENGAGFSNRSDSTLRISGSTFSNNRARGSGGGFLHRSDATTDIANTTLSGNSAGLNGGGLYLDADAGLHVINTTITLNSAPFGSGVGTPDAIDNFPIVSHPLLLFRNTIVAGNIGGPDCHAAFGSEGGNLDGGTLCNFQGPRDRVNVLNLGLEVLADNGGPTLTHALTAASPAVGGGVDTVVDAAGAVVRACPETDQRGVVREQNRACDIGAYEFEGTPESPPSDVTHPETSLDSGPADTTEGTLAIFAFSASEPGSTFECSLDAAPFTPCGSPVEYAALSEGMHTFEVRAIDPAGNTDPTPASFSWTIELPPDGTPPETTIDSSPAAITESRDATFTFSASELNSTFECSLDGVSFAPCTSPAEYAGLTAGSHTFAVRATDLASNQDPTPATYTWIVVPPPDSTPPETTFTSGPAETTESTEAIFVFFANEPGSTFECALDGPSFNSCISPVIYTGLSVGEHTFAVRATDPAGNLELTPASYTWTIEAPKDITPPETTLASGPASPTESTSALFTFSASESGSTFECALDGAPFDACVSSIEYTNLSAGDHTFEVRAIDPAGNVDPTPEMYTWTIEGVEPPPPPEPLDTFIDSGPAATTESRDATFTFSANEDGATFECSLDGAPFAACFSPAEYNGLALGGHTFEVRAINLAGNVDPSPATYAWTVEQPSACNVPMMILDADADAWIDQNSSSTNKGSDSILKVQSKSPNDNFRALVHFALPVNLPAGCVIKSATLSLYAASATPDRTLEALQITEDWSESVVTWANQPATTGDAATSDSGFGYLEWNVAAQVQAMYDMGANNGFLIRDAVENNSGAEVQLHSREKGENPPQLVITFAPAP